MQQKSTQKILLFSVAAQKWKNKSPVQNSWNIGAAGGKVRLRTEARCDSRNNRIQKDGSRYSGADFPAELLVFSGINSSQMDIFLAEYKKAGIEPIGCKAVVTPDNVFWSADKLFREIFKEHLFMSR